MHNNNNHKRNIIIFTTISLIAIIVFLFSRAGLLNIEALTNFIQSFGILAPLAFVIIYIVATMLGVSAILFTILAGVIFGLWKGWILIVISATISANLAFVISRHFKSRLFIPNRHKKNKMISNLVKHIEENAKKNGFVTIVLLRMSFLPFVPLSYAAGLVKNLKMRDFSAATFLTNVTGSFFFIFLGFSITQSLPYLIGAIILILVFSQIPRIIRKIHERSKND